MRVLKSGTPETRVTTRPTGTRASGPGLPRRVAWHRLPVRTVVLAILALGLAFAAVACGRSEQSTTSVDVAGLAEPAVVSGEHNDLILDVTQADVEAPVGAAEASPTAPADVAEISDVEPTPADAPDLSLADLDLAPRPDLSNRSGRRALEPTLDLVAEGAPDLATLADKLERAREMAETDHAVAAVETKAKAMAQPAPTKTVVKRRAATPTPKPVVRTAAPAPVRTATTSSAFGSKVVSIAMRYLGYRYTWSGASPSTGFDCRGFTYWVYLQAGKRIPLTLSGQYGTGRWVSRSQLQPGDLVFFQNTYKAGLSHAGIYIGNGRMISAQSESAGVAIASIDSSYWGPRFLGGRRP